MTVGGVSRRAGKLAHGYCRCAFQAESSFFIGILAICRFPDADFTALSGQREDRSCGGWNQVEPTLHGYNANDRSYGARITLSHYRGRDHDS